MGEGQELQLPIRVQGIQLPSSPKGTNVSNKPPLSVLRHYMWWFRVSVYGFFLISGQSAATLLGRLYYDKGGNSKWMATLVQSAGFPVLFIPLIICHLFPSRSSVITTTTNTRARNPPSWIKLTFLYLLLGILVAGDNMMYSYGLLYLPVSTYSLLCATQLAFNSVFAYFLNSQKLTVLILNSIVLLTISASLLAVNTDSADPTGVSKGKYAIGFLFTVGASAGYALWLSLMQLSFQKIIKRHTLSAVLEMQIFPSIFASLITVVGLFISGDWKNLKAEMGEYEEGKVSYVMTLVWTAVTWQISAVGSVGLIFEASALFSNVISTLALPVVPILSVIFFHDKMNGLKVIVLLLAVWGFASYLYQHYLDDSKSKATRRDADEVCDATQGFCTRISS